MCSLPIGGLLVSRSPGTGLYHAYANGSRLNHPARLKKKKQYSEPLKGDNEERRAAHDEIDLPDNECFPELQTWSCRNPQVTSRIEKTIVVSSVGRTRERVIATMR